MHRRLTLAGLVVGALMLVVVSTLNLGAVTGSMRDSFDQMAAHPGRILIADLLETVGFLLVLGSFAAAARVRRHRGAGLAAWGAPLCLLGIVGFAMSNATALGVVQLAQLPDRDAAFAMALAAFQGGLTALVGTIEMALELLGQVGLLLVSIGLIRARLVGWWVLAPPDAGILVNLALGTAVGTLIADVLLLVVCSMVGVGLARAGREVWLGRQVRPEMAVPATSPVAGFTA